LNTVVSSLLSTVLPVH